MTFKQQLTYIATTKFSNDFENLSRQEQYASVAIAINELAAIKIKDTNERIKQQQSKEVYYFSLEFLMGRLLLNNIENMGMMQEVQEVLNDYNLSIKDLEFEELDAGLGNGGLGRLAACFMDSIASLNYPGHGITIRYRNGFFAQTFVKDEQMELPDLWLQNGNKWENQIFDDACKVSFYGDVVTTEKNGKLSRELEHSVDVLAMPYDMPIVGKQFQTCNTLRMYDIIPVANSYSRPHYEQEVFEISQCLYPDDSTNKGKELRLKQQYVFVSAGLQNIIKKHLSLGYSLSQLPDYVVMQINDTHPTLLIPEMMRILMDQYTYSYQDAWSLTSKCIAYTNHTILAEALEQWDVKIIKPLLPRIYEIIEEIDVHFIQSLKDLEYKQTKINEMKIISSGHVHMAHLAIIASFSVNGVAALHTQILKEKVLKSWHELYPTKLNNKTNGITQRRWFEYSNPHLASLLRAYAKDKDETNPVSWFEQFIHLKEDKEFITKIASIKQKNKRNLIEYIKNQEQIELSEHAIFDIQIKRLHAYKRQLLNVLHIVYLYQRLLQDKEFYDQFYPQTFIFGAKAAPSYVFAKNIIKLIKKLQHVILKDDRTKDKLNLVMVTNYNVSYAEKLIPAADISEQISTAGFEASGTGNMKFMMNGALTLGTLDGANVEIHELVDNDNIEIFGLNKDEVHELHMSNAYNAKEMVNSNPTLQSIFEFILSLDKEGSFEPIMKDLFEDNDYYLVLQDFNAYCKAQENLNTLYRNQDLWYQKTIVNISKSGYFSSDRTIQDYVEDIWKLKKLK